MDSKNPEAKFPAHEYRKYPVIPYFIALTPTDAIEIVMLSERGIVGGLNGGGAYFFGIGREAVR
jgi:hypothetical protein